MLHDLMANDEYSSSHNATSLEDGHPSRVRIFNHRVYESSDILNELKAQIYKIKEIKSEFLLPIRSFGFLGADFFIEEQGGDEGSLKALMIREKVSQKAGLQYAIAICEGIKAAHAGDIILGNIKPSTIRTLKGRTIMLTDLGISVTLSSLLHRINPTIEAYNNIHYMAPEVRTSGVSALSDIYSAGCVIYELLCKVSPFEDYQAEGDILNAHKNYEALSPKIRKPSLSQEVSDIVMSLISKEPSQRPVNLHKVIECLKVNLANVEDIQVEDIKRGFDAPMADQTLRPRPPTELNMNLLSGDKSSLQKKKDTQADINKFLGEENIRVKPEIKLQNTAIDIQELNNLQDDIPIKNNNANRIFKLIIAVLLLIIIAIVVFFAGDLFGPDERKILPNEEVR